ncbi:MAG: hypothetical protein GY754_14290 [bacterium]|nr:hypothetical protein [bacterium]
MSTTDPNNTDENVKITRELLEKCMLTAPVSKDQKKYIKENRRKSLVATLKKTGQYTPLSGAVLYVFFGMTKLGIKLSIVQSAVALGVISFAAVTTVSTGSYVAVKKFVLTPSIEKQIEEKQIEEKQTGSMNEMPVKDPASTKAENSTKPVVKPVVEPVVKTKLAITPFEFLSQSGDKTIPETIRQKIRAGLSRLKGKDYQKLTNKKMIAGMKYVMTGRVLKAENAYRIKVEILDLESGDTVFEANEKSTLDDLDRTCRDISKKAAAKIQ